MKFFIDTANLDQIREANELGVLDGVTTNPSLMAKEGIKGVENQRRHYIKICEMVDGDVSAEVIATDYEGMIKEGEELAGLNPHIVVKVPCIEAGIKAIKYFSGKGIRTNCTLVFSPGQDNQLDNCMVMGDFNAYSPFDADWVETHAQLIKNKQKWDAEQETYRNMRDGRLDYSVLSQFLSIGLTDICRLYVPADKRTTFPTAFLYRWQHGDTRLHGISERLDYILVSPSLVSRCVDAHIHNGIETEGISDHYPVSVDLIIHL
jgi:hypothetical protein